MYIVYPAKWHDILFCVDWFFSRSCAGIRRETSWPSGGLAAHGHHALLGYRNTTANHHLEQNFQ